MVDSAVRAAVYNAHWETLGGGEQLAGGMASALARRHDVDLLVRERFDAVVASERLGFDLTGFPQLEIPLGTRAFLELSERYDLLANTSFSMAVVVAFGPLVVGSHRLRRCVLPEWSGPPGWLAQIAAVMAACLVTVLGLGVIHIYSLVPTTVVLAAIGGAMYVVGSRVRPRSAAPLERAPNRLGRAGHHRRGTQILTGHRGSARAGRNRHRGCRPRD